VPGTDGRQALDLAPLEPSMPADRDDDRHPPVVGPAAKRRAINSQKPARGPYGQAIDP
jgi:hypothetical protein